MTTSTAHKETHGAAHAAPAHKARHIETSRAATKLPGAEPLPPDPLDALKTGLTDLTGELDALTRLPDNFSPEARERIGKIQKRIAELNVALGEHVENVKRDA